MSIKKKKLIIVLTFVLLVLLGVTIYTFSTKSKATSKVIKKEKYNYTPEKREEIKEEILDNISQVTSENATINSLKNAASKEQVVNVFLTVGKDSYLRNKPSDEIIERYNLSSLKEKQDYYASKVEKKYLDNLNYEVVSEEVGQNNLCENIEITTYYYSLYLNDYINIVSSLSGSMIDGKETKEELEEKKVNNYKIQVAALKVLDKYLDDYDNFTNEKEKVKICYENGELKDKDQMLTLLIALQGELYSNMNMGDEVVVRKSDERLQKYLKEIEEVQ